MKHEVEELVVEVTENGRPVRRSYPIFTEDGKVMTHRLGRLLAGKLGGNQDSQMNNEIHFVGLIWYPPYTVLQKLVADRHAMQDSLLIREGHSDLSDKLFPMVPLHAPDDEITRLVANELRARREIKKRLMAINNKPYCYDV